jgi:excisionase family DNA binding protein
MNQDPYAQKDLLSTEDVATYIGVGPVTVHRWCREGRLPCMKIGKHWRIRRESLESFLEQMERSESLVGRLRPFLEVPDNVLVVAQALVLGLGVVIRGDLHPTGWSVGITVLLFGTFLAVGGVVATRLPRHPIGWLLIVTGVAVATLSVGSLLYDVASDPWLRSLGAWLDAGLWHPSFPALGLLVLLFPTGGPPSTRWRWLSRSLLVAWAFLVSTAPLTTPGMMVEFYPDAGPVVPGPWSPLLAVPHDAVQMTAILGLLPLAAASMVVRAVRSSGLERQQLAWFATSVVVIVVVFPLSLNVLGTGALGAASFILLPISCAIAVLRYRLYDLGRLVRRGLVYTVLTAMLLAVYGVGTVILGELVGRQPGEGGVGVVARPVEGPVDQRLQPAPQRPEQRRDRHGADGDRQQDEGGGAQRSGAEHVQAEGEHHHDHDHGRREPCELLPLQTGRAHRAYDHRRYGQREEPSRRRLSPCAPASGRSCPVNRLRSAPPPRRRRPGSPRPAASASGSGGSGRSGRRRGAAACRAGHGRAA